MALKRLTNSFEIKIQLSRMLSKLDQQLQTKILKLNGNVFPKKMQALREHS